MQLGIEEIDQQHQTMVDRLNRMNEAFADESSAAVIGSLLADLSEYTRYHFSCEEELHETHGYPHADEHGEIHDSLIQKVADLEARYQQGESDLACDILDLLQEWVFEHIKEHDMRFKAYLDQQNITI